MAEHTIDSAIGRAFSVSAADFDGDGIDELAIVRGNQVQVDSNGNIYTGEVDTGQRVQILRLQGLVGVHVNAAGDGPFGPVAGQLMAGLRSVASP